MSDRRRVLIVEARFYEDISDALVAGATAALDGADVACDRVAVPGVFEIPAAIHIALKAMKIHSSPADYAGFIALGCVIRGETDHYEFICREASRALMELSVNYTIAFGFGLITCENADQAWARAKADKINVGGSAAEACLRMMEIKKDFHLTHR
ncbi:MAG: 6,7-dimethyl-8-ribityllumazine synthase [Rhodospirillales bacterium]|nr:6,7-dimethyl-8-ribityllumazine synthase [Rhodospirillales bacterium]